jgi:hypothetical protein
MPSPIPKNPPEGAEKTNVSESTAQDHPQTESEAGLALSKPYHDLPAVEQQPQEPEVVEAPGNIFSESGERTFRTLTLRDTVFVLISNRVGLGVLALPDIMHTLGLAPATLAIVGIGILSTYTAFELLQLYRKYPHCANIVDMAKVVGGKPLEVAVAIGLMANLCLTCASASVTISVALNTITEHMLCTVAWIGLAVVASWLLCLPRTFKFVALVGMPATTCIIASVLIVVISLSLGSPRGAPEGYFDKDIKYVGNPGFKNGLRACLNVCYAFAGNVGYPSLFPEMKNPSKHFYPALVWLQIFTIPLYILVGLGIYLMAGQYTTSPALGCAPEVPAKVAYGVVLPAVLSTALVFGHTAVKYMYVVLMRALQATEDVAAHSVTSWTAWVGSVTLFWSVVFVLANAVPVFDSILSISSSTFAAWFTFGIGSVFWFFLNRGRLLSTREKAALAVLNGLLILQVLFMNGAGLWAAITNIVDVYEKGEGGIRGPFTCADNSLF